MNLSRQGGVLQYNEICYFYKNGLLALNSEIFLIGEGHPFNGETQKGCNYADIGYNVEKSLPALINYAYEAGVIELFF